MLTREEVQLVFEALLAAYDELETVEKDFDDYITTGPLMDRLEEAMRIVESKL